MTDAVIVSTARTPIAKAFRGGFNNLSGASLGAASVAEAVKRAGIDPGEIDDVIMGSALQQGSLGTIAHPSQISSPQLHGRATRRSLSVSQEIFEASQYPLINSNLFIGIPHLFFSR